ncbi:MAG: cobalamin-dependent protein [Deltaproteobacteria bacterium]|nr:cobalamin-dependent protein [Deltaproteobacteria bacterium]
MARCLLVNPSSALSLYANSKVRAAIPKLPTMSLAMLAGALLEDGHEVKIVDLMIQDPQRALEFLKREATKFCPELVGVTATTPLFYEAARISQTIKDISADIVTVLGGPHATALPAECLQESTFDYVVTGEGELTIKNIAAGRDLDAAHGVFGRALMYETPCVPKISKDKLVSLDDLPMPALHLYDSSRYSCPSIIARKNPVGPIEMSRGCLSNCSFCNKNIQGRTFRVKFPLRVIEELKVLKKLGYREFHVLDDQFTTNIQRAKEICAEIIKHDLKMTWNLRTGVRVDRVDKEFLDLAKRSGCYQVGVGFESGSQEHLDRVGKGAKLEQAFKAAALIRQAGIELVGFFIIGLPEESVQTMEDTIRFAIKLNPDYAKATILVPFPGTEIYNEFASKGLIKIREWDKYNFHSANQIYQHPTLSWDCLQEYYQHFHRRFYLRPHYLLGKLWQSVITGRLLDNLYFGYQTFLQKDIRQ